MKWEKTNKGFTIVELLIVIVVIAILAAITIVSFNGIQNRAKDSALITDLNAVKKAVQMYQVDNSAYPICSGGDGMSCLLDTLNSTLVPKYISKLPTSNTIYPHYYVGTNNGEQRWSIRAYKSSTAIFCKAGDNMLTMWWSNAPEC